VFTVTAPVAAGTLATVIPLFASTPVEVADIVTVPAAIPVTVNVNVVFAPPARAAVAGQGPVTDEVPVPADFQAPAVTDPAAACPPFVTLTTTCHVPPVQTDAGCAVAVATRLAAFWTVTGGETPAEAHASFAVTVPDHAMTPALAAVAVQVNMTDAPGARLAADVVAAFPVHEAAADALQTDPLTALAAPAPVFVTVIMTRTDWPVEITDRDTVSPDWNTTDGPSVNAGPAADTTAGAHAVAPAA
jgi:hypothetical protein